MERTIEITDLRSDRRRHDQGDIEIALRERTKELEFFYHVTEAIMQCRYSITVLVDMVVRHVPEAFLYAGCCGVLLTVHDIIRRSERYTESRWRLIEDIRADGQVVGRIDVSYAAERFAEDDPFLPEERRLIRVLAQRLGTVVELIHARETILAERAALQAKNTALRAVIALAQEDTDDLAAQVVGNVKHVLLPIVASLENALPATLRGYASLLRRSLDEIVSPLVSRIPVVREALTPAELQVCDLISQGLTAKEISRIKAISPVTVFRHRQAVRRKLGLTNKRINLASYLHNVANHSPDQPNPRCPAASCDVRQVREPSMSM